MSERVVPRSFFARDPKPRIQYDTTIVTRRDTVYITRIDTIRPIAQATPTTVAGKPIVIGAINFAFNKSDITPEAKKILDLIAGRQAGDHDAINGIAEAVEVAARGKISDAGEFVLRKKVGVEIVEQEIEGLLREQPAQDADDAFAHEVIARIPEIRAGDDEVLRRGRAEGGIHQGVIRQGLAGRLRKMIQVTQGQV